MNVDGSVTPVPFRFTVPDNRSASIYVCNTYILDSGLRADRYGGIVGGLANGCLCRALGSDGSTVLIDYMDGEALQLNYDFAALAGVDIVLSDTPGDDALVVRWDLARAGGPTLLGPGEILEMIHSAG